MCEGCDWCQYPECKKRSGHYILPEMYDCKNCQSNYCFYHWNRQVPNGGNVDFLDRRLEKCIRCPPEEDEEDDEDS